MRIAGPLNPQCVIRSPPIIPCFSTRGTFKGRCCSSSNFTVALRLIPESSLIKASSVAKVNREGTGGMMVCPSWANSVHTLGLLPVVITNALAGIVPLEE